jgi:hypothetical protein
MPAMLALSPRVGYHNFYKVGFMATNFANQANGMIA